MAFYFTVNVLFGGDWTYDIWVSMSLHLTTMSSSLLFDYTYRDYLLAANHQIDGTRTDLAPVLIMLSQTCTLYITQAASGSAFKMQSFYNPAKHTYSGTFYFWILSLEMWYFGLKSSSEAGPIIKHGCWFFLDHWKIPSKLIDIGFPTLVLPNVWRTLYIWIIGWWESDKVPLMLWIV